jgi:NAD-dependent DNA ligase
MENGRQLPDNMRLREVIGLDIPAKMRLMQLVWEHEHLTVGDVRRMSDSRLLRYPNIGRKCAASIREFFGKEQALSNANIADIPDVITELRSRITELERRVVWLESGCEP